MSKHNYNTGAQPRSLNSGYCGVRALVIASGMDWGDAERHLKEHTSKGKAGNKALSRGIYKEDYDSALQTLGWQWNAAPKFTGRKARPADIPGVIIARQARHYCAVIDGVTQDIWDCSEKMVYGYWRKIDS